MYCYEQKYNYLISLLLYCSLHFFQNVAIQWTNNNNSRIMMNDFKRYCQLVGVHMSGQLFTAIVLVLCLLCIVTITPLQCMQSENFQECWKPEKFANWHAKNKGKAPYKRLPRGSICRTRDGDQVDRHLPLLQCPLSLETLWVSFLLYVQKYHVPSLVQCVLFFLFFCQAGSQTSQVFNVVEFL